MKRLVNGNYYPRIQQGVLKRRTAPKKPGFIYVIRVETTDFYKIGFTNDFEARMAAILVYNPLDIIVVAKIYVPNCFTVEASLHKTFSTKNHRSEWFKLSELDIHYIKEFLKTVEIDYPVPPK